MGWAETIAQPGRFGPFAIFRQALLEAGWPPLATRLGFWTRRESGIRQEVAPQCGTYCPTGAPPGTMERVFWLLQWLPAWR